MVLLAAAAVHVPASTCALATEPSGLRHRSSTHVKKDLSSSADVRRSTKLLMSRGGLSGSRRALIPRPCAMKPEPVSPPLMQARTLLGDILEVDKADRLKDALIPLRRNVFTPEDWIRHRSSGRHIRHITTIPNSRMLAALGPPVRFMGILATIIVTWNELLSYHYLPDYLPVLHINALPISLTGSALSLLLVFRTNVSYARFDEARKIWGLMLNRTRDIARQGLTYMARAPNTHQRPKLDQFLRHVAALPLTLKHHLVPGDGDLETDLKTETSLTATEISALLAATHRPNYVLLVCSECLRSCTMERYNIVVMDANLTSFADDVGGCERILKTPIPLSYTRLTSRFLVLWHCFLPLAMYDALHLLTVPATCLSTAALFCIEEVGVLIEEPFTILALGAIAATARANIKEYIAIHDDIKDIVAPDAAVENGAFSTLADPASQQENGRPTLSDSSVLSNTVA